MLFERNLDRRDAALGLGGRDARLRAPACVRREELRSRKRVEPPVVLTGDEMKRSAVQPGDDELALR